MAEGKRWVTALGEPERLQSQETARSCLLVVEPRKDVAVALGTQLTAHRSTSAYVHGWVGFALNMEVMPKFYCQ